MYEGSNPPNDRCQIFNLKNRKEIKSEYGLSNLQGTIKQPDTQVCSPRKEKENLDQIIVLMK